MKKLLYSLLLAGSLQMAVPMQGTEDAAHLLSMPAPSTRFAASFLATKLATNVGYPLTKFYGLDHVSRWFATENIITKTHTLQGTMQWALVPSLNPDVYAPLFSINLFTTLLTFATQLDN
jgi:hypothetical protein